MNSVLLKKRIEKRAQREARVGFEFFNHLHLRSSQLKLRATRHELKVHALLTQLGIRFKFQKGFTKGGVMFIADFYLPKPIKCVIEVDGNSHRDESQRVKDIARDVYFRTVRRFHVLRITNREVETMSAANLEVLVRQVRVLCSSNLKVLAVFLMNDYERR